MNYTEDILDLEEIEACKVYETITEIRRETEDFDEFEKKVMKELSDKYNDDNKKIYGGIIVSMYEDDVDIKLDEEETETIIRNVIDNVRIEIANNLDDFVKRING